MPQDRDNGVNARRGEQNRNDGLGALVQAQRQAMGLTQQQCADLAGISLGTLRDLEQGRTHQPLSRSITRLASLLGQALTAVSSQEPRDTQDPRPCGGPRRGGMGLTLRILGPLAAWRNGTPVRLGGPKQQAVLGLLALSPNVPIRREAVVDAIWGEDCPATVVTVVQEYISRLRQILDPGACPRDTRGILVSTGTSYRLHIGHDQLDLLAFRQLGGRARAASLSGDHLAACRLYERALDLWHGEPLADTNVLRGHPAITYLSREHANVISGFAQAGFAVGRYERVLPHLYGLAAAEPLNERAHAQLMIALAHAGQPAAALQVFEGIRQRLAYELGVRPDRELSGVHLQLLRRNLPAPTAVPPPRAPRSRRL